MEIVIEKGLETFVEVGLALAEIRDRKLYAQTSFDEYCKDRWNFGESRAYQLIRSSKLTRQLDTGTPPSRPSHVNQLSIIKTPELRNRAWEEVTSTGDDITGDLVKIFARKYYVIERDENIGDLITRNQITSQQAYLVYKKLQSLPPYYRDIFLRFPSLSAETLGELRRFEYDQKDEFLEMMNSGYLDNGRDTIPVGDLTVRDIQAYSRKLAWEAKQARIIDVTTIQKKETGLLILDGVNIPEQLHEHSDGKRMVYLFPEKAYTPTQVAQFLEKGEYDVLFIAAYTKDEPLIKFDEYRAIKPSSINGVKPQYLLNTLKQLSNPV